MTVGELLLMVEVQLSAAGVIRPRRHAELILQTVLGLERVRLYLSAANAVGAEARAAVQALTARRIAGEPVQYIAGWAPFYGLNLEVGPGVFIPRFETETIVDYILEQLNADKTNQTFEVLDLCAGSGAVGIALAAQSPRLRVTLVEKEPVPVAYAISNIRRYGLAEQVQVVQMDALGDFPPEWRGRFRYITANPPYIPLSQIADLPPDVRDGEPHSALTDGGDGLGFHRVWRHTIPSLLSPNGLFLTEVGDGQADSVMEIYPPHLEIIGVANDLDGNRRVVIMGKHYIKQRISPK